MPLEIERKFLVQGAAWRTAPGLYFCQGYLNRDKHRTVRVRIAGPKAFLTVKGLTMGASRSEFEYEIPLPHAEELLKICDGPLVEKVRRDLRYGDFTWEIDEFLGSNKGLVVAEIELPSADATFEKPPWLGLEVTDDPRYFNSNLAAHPYASW